MPRLATSLYILALIPTLPLLAFLILPANWRETYAWWDASSLNSIRLDQAWADGGRHQWRNMGYWKDTDDFSKAAEALGRKLIEFANAPKGGSVLDLGAGMGESLILHLQQTPPPTHLHALTSLSSETVRSRELVSSYLASLPSSQRPNTTIDWYSYPGVPKEHDYGHPLHPMRGFLGDGSQARSRSYVMEDEYEDEDEKEDDIEEEGEADKLRVRQSASQLSASDQMTLPQPSPPPYTLIYALDAAYHFPPSIPAVIASSYRHLAPAGILAYTDILPPPSIADRPLLARLISFALGVPLPNLLERPSDLAGYKEALRKEGYERVDVQDWSEWVWDGFATNLENRGGAWRFVARAVRRADSNGWRFLAVRIERPDDGAPSL